MVELQEKDPESIGSEDPQLQKASEDYCDREWWSLLEDWIREP